MTPTPLRRRSVRPRRRPDLDQRAARRVLEADLRGGARASRSTSSATTSRTSTASRATTAYATSCARAASTPRPRRCAPSATASRRSSSARSPTTASRPYPGSVRWVEQLRGDGVRTAVVSSSANCRAVLRAAGIARPVRADGRRHATSSEPRAARQARARRLPRGGVASGRDAPPCRRGGGRAGRRGRGPRGRLRARDRRRARR